MCVEIDELDPSSSMVVAVIGALRRGRGQVKGQGVYSVMMRSEALLL